MGLGVGRVGNGAFFKWVEGDFAQGDLDPAGRTEVGLFTLCFAPETMRNTVKAMRRSLWS